MEGSLVVESNVTGLVGDVLYSDPAGTKPFRAAFALESGLTKSATFAQVDNSAGRITELDIANPNAQTVTVDITVFRADGSQTGVKTLQIPAGGAITDQLGTLVPASSGQSGGYFVISANQRVAAS